MVRVLFFLFFLASCQKLQNTANYIDFKSFQSLEGKTLFSRPNNVTLKEIHLDSHELFGQLVIVEGTIVEIGKFSTHLVISDATARMLVLLTSVAGVMNVGKFEVGSHISILGFIEDGKKGLPLVRAKSFYIVNQYPTSSSSITDHN